MSAKRQAHVAAIAEADHAQAQSLMKEWADASAARTWPISVHLTPFAPGCADLRIDDRRRWRTFYGRTVEAVLRSTLTRLALVPTECRAAQEGNDTALLAPVPPEVLKLVSSRPGEIVPHALFWDGVTADQLRGALDTLADAGWRPPAKLLADA